MSRRDILTRQAALDDPGFAGRKLGVLLTNGADAGTLATLRAATAAQGATVEIIAPAVGQLRYWHREFAMAG